MDFKENFNSAWSYKFQRLLDSGGSADVLLYTRYMEGLPDQEVVLKVLRDPQVDLAELLNEGRRLSELKHANILSTLGYEKIGPSKFALVLEYIKGKNLREILPKIKAQDRSEVASYVIRLSLQALQTAHSQKIIHGDISSRNILVSDKGEIKLSDFGESRNLGSATNVSSQKGSVDYLAPERWSGAATSMESDVFSLGMLALELLSGFSPLTGATLKTGQARITDFLKKRPWKRFEPWDSFFSKTLLLEPGRRETPGILLKSIPASNLGREILLEYFQSSDVVDKIGPAKTSTIVFSFHFSQYLRLPVLKPLIIMLSLVNSVAIGIDHSLNLGRLKPSSLTLTSSPWGEVFIDGNSLGYTPLLNVYFDAGHGAPGRHVLVWRDAAGTTVRRTIMDYGNGLFAYQIIKTKGRPITVAPLMNSGDKEGLEP